MAIAGEGCVAGELIWREPAESRVRSFGVVVVFPLREFNTDLMQCGKQGFVQLLIAQF